MSDATGWTSPRPPYPARARLNREQGTLFLKVTTDKAGVVTKVVASVPREQRQDMKELGASSVRWVLARWHGPPNVVRMVTFDYKLK